MSANEKLGARTARFPAGASMGVLFTREWGMPGYGGWAQLAEARGEVAVPAGKELMLQLNWSASASLAPLEKLKPDDLQWLDCRDSQINDAQMACLRGLTGLHDLGLGHTAVGDEGLRHVGALPGLKELYLAGTKATGAGLAALAGLKALEALALNDTAIDDAAAPHLGGLGSLQRLWLKNTRISDAGLEPLKKLRSLRRLDLRATRATEAGLADLKRALPRCYFAKAS